VINYRFPEEKEIMLHYAKHSKDSTTENIINKGGVSNSSEAAYLANFFWLMVDQSVKDIEQGKDAAGHFDLVKWSPLVGQPEAKLSSGSVMFQAQAAC